MVGCTIESDIIYMRNIYGCTGFVFFSFDRHAADQVASTSLTALFVTN